jgi:hypothetical protein
MATDGTHLGTADHGDDMSEGLARASAREESLLDHHLEELVALMRDHTLSQGEDQAGVDL